MKQDNNDGVRKTFAAEHKDILHLIKQAINFGARDDEVVEEESDEESSSSCDSDFSSDS